MKKLYVTIMQFITMLKLKKDKGVWEVINPLAPELFFSF